MFQIFQWLVLALVWQGAATLADVDITVTGSPTYTVRGEGDGDVNYFYGIPYSQPRTPLFEGRFALPVEYEPENSLLMAKEQRHECVQNSGAGSEDCLYLDIYMPATASPSNKKPVMVWIHGGSWMTGSKNEYSGKFWASQQWTAEVDRVLVVTINYRMNILGFPDIDDVSRNLGMHDSIMALKWVKNHIDDFGGDSSHTTIFGESAGSMLVLQLWASSAANGLFTNAISQSPYSWSFEYGTNIPTEAKHELKRERTASCLENAKSIACGPGGSSSMAGGSSNPNCTYQSPSIAEMQNASCFGFWYGPMSDGGVTISDTFFKDMCGSVAMGSGKPLLVGFNMLEVNLWQFMGGTAGKTAQMRTWVEHLAPTADQASIFQCIGDMYAATGKMQNPAKNPLYFPGGTTEQEAKDIYSTDAIFFKMVSQTLMQLPNVHMYAFNESAAHNQYGILCSNPLGAHTCETPFVISHVNNYNMSNGIDNLLGGAPMDTSVQQNMRKVWAQFAISGNPGWAHDEVGEFTDDQIVIRTNGAIFDPSIKNLLNKLMCHPASIPATCDIPHSHTCSDMKRLFKKNFCCGNPNKIFDLHVEE